jgi:hypothetical protein
MEPFDLLTFVEMYKLNLPSFDFKLKQDAGRALIFDENRKRFVKLNPEEWVRQHWLKTLVDHYACPMGRISIEKELIYNNTKRRTDLLVYDEHAKPILLAEFKAPEVKISESSFEQIGIYNTQLQVPWLLVSNGIEHRVFKLDVQLGNIRLVEELPHYSQLAQP